MENEIKRYYKEKYKVNVENIEVRPSLHMGSNIYQYSSRLKDDKLAVLSGYYNSKENSFSEVTVDFVLFQSELSQEIRRILGQQYAIVKVKFIVWGKSKGLNFKEESLRTFNAKYKDKCKYNIHIYCFNNSERDSINWLELKPVIEYTKQYPLIKFSVLFSYYPVTAMNSDSFINNKFGFGLNYQGFETDFEGEHFNSRLDYFEVRDVHLDALVSSWEEKIKQ